MMRPSLPLLALGAIGALGLPGCPDPTPQPPAGNPTTLWLAPLGSDEKHVQLADSEPPHF